MMQRTDSGLMVPRQRGIVVPGRDFPHPREKRRASYISSGWNKRDFNLNYGGVAAGGDPFWADVFLLMNGSATVTTDSSSFNQPLALSGNLPAIELDATVPLFGFPTYKTFGGGAQTGKIIQTTDFIKTNVNSGTKEWCFEYFFRPTLVGNDERHCGANNVLLGLTTGLAANVSYPNLGGSSYSQQTANGAITLNGPWYHMAHVRDNVTDPVFTLLRSYLNGVLFATTTGINKAGLMQGSAFSWLLGWGGNPTRGNFSQIRFTRNTARYYADFTPPTAPFPTF